MPANGIVAIQIPEHPIEGKRLGRHVAHDPRSLDFAAERAPQVTSVTHAATGLPLDQGQIGSCTANALCGALDSAPDYTTGVAVMTEQNAVTLYERETQLEGQPYPPNDPGGSGLMVCKAAKQLGMISSYKHAFGIEHALGALVLRPVITGINWYTSFDSPIPPPAWSRSPAVPPCAAATRWWPTGSTPTSSSCGCGTAGAPAGASAVASA